MLINRFFHKNVITCDFDRRGKAIDVAQECQRFVIIYGYPYYNNKKEWVHASTLTGMDPEELSKEWLRMDGAFTLCSIDLDSKIMHIYTDRYRLFCLYYISTDTSIHISDNISELKTYSSGQYDQTALYALYCMNCTIGNSTLFNDVRTFDEGLRIEITASGRFESVPYFSFPKRGETASESEVLDVFSTHFRKGLDLSGHISLAITAGLDSRALLAMAADAKDRLHTYTHGIPASQDVKTAKRIAGQFGVKHTFYNLRDCPVFRSSIPAFEVEVNTAYEGMLNALSHAHAAHVYKMQAAKADTFFSAFGGELFRSYYLPDRITQNMSLEALAAGIRAKSTVRVDYAVFQHTEKEINERLDGFIYAELKKGDSDDHVYLADWYYHRRNFNSVTSRFAGKYFRLFMPYFSEAVYDLAVRIPVEWKKNGYVHTSLIKHFAPRLTAIPVNGRPFLHGEASYPMYDWLSMNKRRLQRVLHYVSKGRRYPAYFTDYGEWIRNGHMDHYTSLADIVRDDDPVLVANKWKDHMRKTFSVNKSFNGIKFTTNVLSTLSYLRSM